MSATRGASAANGGGSSGGARSTCCSKSAAKLPEKGQRPVKSSKTMTPSEYKSVRASTACPSICSGDMYWGVPIMAPIAVSCGPPSFAE
jgi:hypothetical protein